MEAKKGIWFGCITFERGLHRHNFFFSGLAASAVEAKKLGLAAGRKEYPARSVGWAPKCWRVINKVAYRIDDSLITELLRSQS